MFTFTNISILKGQCHAISVNLKTLKYVFASVKTKK